MIVASTRRAEPAARILVVDDDAMSRKLLSYVLGEARYTVVSVDSAEAAARVLAQEQVHLLILDIRLPKMDGLEFCRKLREDGNAVPILFLSGRQDIDDKIAGFDAGGDDYLTKPFDTRELLSRVRALLHRQIWGIASGKRSTLKAGGLELDLSELQVMLPSGREVQLTPTEMRILQCLMTNSARVVRRDLLLAQVWGYDYQSASNQIEVYIRRIRRKIEVNPSDFFIETVRGLGYRFVGVGDGARAGGAPATVGA